MALSKSSITSFLSGLDPITSIDAITAGVKAAADPDARATYLRANHTADTGDPTEIDARPRLEALIGLRVIREAITRSASPLSPDRVWIENVVGACFVPRLNLTEFVELLIADNNVRTQEVRRLAGELVAELTNDSSSALLAADGRGGGVAFAPDALDPTGDTRAEQIAGVA